MYLGQYVSKFISKKRGVDDSPRSTGIEWFRGARMGLKKNIEWWQGVAERVLRGGFARRGIRQNPSTG